MDRLMSMARWLAQGAMSAILSYCNGIIERSKKWLSTAAESKPEKPAHYDALRDAVFAADEAVIAANIAVLEYGSQISRMLEAPQPPAGAAARQKQIKKKTDEGDELKIKLENAKLEYQKAQQRFEPTFELYKKRIAEHQAGFVAEKSAVANKWMKAANRVLEAIKTSPQLGSLGDIALFSVALAYEEGRKPGERAKSTATTIEPDEPHHSPKP